MDAPLNFWMLKYVNEDGTNYYKPASGTSGATPKLYLSKKMAEACAPPGFIAVRAVINFPED